MPIPEAPSSRKPDDHRRSKPISVRLDKGLLKQIDAAAKKLDATRSTVIEAVLYEYVVERGTTEVKRIVKEAPRAKVNLFG